MPIPTSWTDWGTQYRIRVDVVQKRLYEPTEKPDGGTAFRFIAMLRQRVVFLKHAATGNVAIIRLHWNHRGYWSFSLHTPDMGYDADDGPKFRSIHEHDARDYIARLGGYPAMMGDGLIRDAIAG